MLLAAVAFTTWLQAGSTVAAATAALASCVAVAQSRKLTRESREPDLVVTANFIESTGRKPTMGATIVNGGGSIARHVSLILATTDEVGRCPVASGILRPGDFATFGSEMTADSEHLGVVFGRGPDRDFIWNLDGQKRTIKRGEKLPSYEAIFAAFYPDVDLSRHRPVPLLRG